MRYQPSSSRLSRQVCVTLPAIFAAGPLDVMESVGPLRRRLSRMAGSYSVNLPRASQDNLGSFVFDGDADLRITGGIAARAQLGHDERAGREDIAAHGGGEIEGGLELQHSIVVHSAVALNDRAVVADNTRMRLAVQIQTTRERRNGERFLPIGTDFLPGEPAVFHHSGDKPQAEQLPRQVVILALRARKREDHRSERVGSDRLAWSARAPKRRAYCQYLVAKCRKGTGGVVRACKTRCLAVVEHGEHQRFRAERFGSKNRLSGQVPVGTQKMMV